MVNVTIYSSTMDPMGYGFNIFNFEAATFINYGDLNIFKLHRYDMI